MRFCGKDEAKDLANMATEIWMDYYTGFLDPAAVEHIVRLVQSEDAIMRQIGEGHLYSFITDGDIRAGYLCIVPEGDILYISKFYLSKGFRGQGLGSKSMDAILEKGRELGMRKAYLRANKNNIPSIEFYRRKGFTITDDILEDIGNGFFLDDHRLEYNF